MKKFSIQAVLLLLVIGMAFFLFNSGSSISFIPFVPQPAKIQKLHINNTTLNVEVADTADKRRKGLGGRESLGQTEGMLFIFDKADRYSFWMKGLKFPLDFVWIRGDTVVDTLDNALPPSPGQPDNSLPVYTPKEEVDKVLEINAGMTQVLNIKAGDKIRVE